MSANEPIESAAPPAGFDAVGTTSSLAAPSAVAGPADGLGAVFTKPWAVDLVLNMAGYTADNDLAAGLAIEPSCGSGAFVVPMINRLAESCRRYGRDLEDAENAIRGWDLNSTSVQAARHNATTALRANGVNSDRAALLARSWIHEGDFLLNNHADANWIVGNPPYVRLEDVPQPRSAAYRARWDTMNGRADVYVGFIQASLEALKPDGVLAFICADRWMRNQYGRHLRARIEDRYAVDGVITLHDSDAFEARVAAYPAVFALRNGPQQSALIADADGSFTEEGARHLTRVYSKGPTARRTIEGPGYSAAWTQRWFTGSPSWPTGKPDRIATVAELEQRLPAIGDPESGIRLGIGLASGADAIYLTKSANEVEPARLMPMVMAADLKDGRVEWSGTRLVNPWDSDALVNLDDFPRTRAYFHTHQNRLKNRHVGRRQPDRWYRTIDRPIDGLAETPKLLVADLRPRVAPVLDTDGLYPHHNLFWITSDEWDLRVLGGLLLSDFGTLFVETYSPRMAGGALRVTAQYLRRIRVPQWSTLTDDVRDALANAFERRDVEAATIAAAVAYKTSII